MTEQNIVVFVQTRLGSTRLPGKALKEVLGKPLVVREVERIRRAKTVDNVVVITSDLPRDNAVVELCEKHQIPWARGSELDLVDRYYTAANQFKADFVVKIPSDCPFTDPDVIDEVIGLWKNNQDKYEYVSNYHPPTFPDGLDVEGSTFSALETMWKEAKKPHEREHGFPFIWDQPDRFRLGNVLNPRGDMFMTHRWTLDYQEDFDFITAVYQEFGEKLFSFDDILDLLKRKPEIAQINAKYNGVNWYRNLAEGELKTVTKDQFKKSPDEK
jgi:spore coat polysaccharide biosynthesis protein SpsF